MGTPAELLADRQALLAHAGPPSSARREALSAATDNWILSLAREAGLASIDGTLVAVGGYGRRQLAPGSDLDLLLLHPKSSSSAEVAAVADRIWYPIWDSGIALDHSVRTLPETRRLASGDLKVVFGLLDARSVAGNAELGAQVKASVLADWRALARNRLPEVYESVQERIARARELAHLLEPDLKESYGGLRDVVLLRAVAASWITDYPHDAVNCASTILLDVRDALHRVAGRATDRLAMQDQSAVADIMGFPSDDDLLRAVIDAGRAISYAADLTWHRTQRLTRKQPAFRRLRSQPADERVPLADGVIAQNGEVFLARESRPDRDPALLLRSAAAAAQAGMRLAPETVDRFASNAATIPQPWPRAAREAFVSLLGAGPAAIPVWEALDNVGIMSDLLPHWRHVRSLPQRNALHMYTVDRHQLETAAEAAKLTRAVHRPDLLLVGALFHDIGKGRGPEHSSTGAELMADIGPRLGFSPADTAILQTMVQHHLLLAETATRRDPDDPATITGVADAVHTHETLDLLHALTEADSRATGPGVWSDWKQRLLADLVGRVHASLSGDIVAEQRSLAQAHPSLLRGSDVEVRMDTSVDGVRIVLGAPDRVGLLARVAGVMSLQHLEVRAAVVETEGDRALQSWLALPAYGDAPSVDALVADIRQAIAGTIDVDTKVRARVTSVQRRRGFVPPPPRVGFIKDASDRADVLEVRAHDEPALLWRVAHVLAHVGVTVLSARVSTLGSEAIDVMYILNADGSRLRPHEQESLIEAVRNTIGAAD